MQTVRTTITLPRDLHEELRLASVKQNKSMSRLITERMTGKKKTKKGVFLLSKMARKLKADKVDWVKEIRKQRDKRTKHLAKFI